MSWPDFHQPGWLWLLLAVPALGVLVVLAERRRRAAIARIVSSRLLRGLLSGANPVFRRIKAGLLLAALAFGIVALAQPHAGYTLREARTSGRDVILAVDTSRSMLAEDMQPNRLVRARLLADDLIRQLPGDRIGVVAFAGSAFLQAPLTVDHGAVIEAVQALDTEIIPRGGSNIAAAIRVAIEAFGKGESANRALVVISDGEELDANAMEAALEAREALIRIFAVGVGTGNGSVIPVPDGDGGTRFVKDAAGRIVTSRLDETRLRELADATNGQYYNLQTNPDAGRAIAEAVRAMEATEAESEILREPVPRYQWPLGLAVACLILSLVMPERPGSNPWRRGRRAAAPAALVLLAVWSGAGFARADDGMVAYDAGVFERAYQRFQSEAARAGATPREHFNAGTAAYKAGEYGDAIRHLGSAMSARDAETQALAAYNLGNALYKQAVNAPVIEQAIAGLEDAISKYHIAESLPRVGKDAMHNRQIAENLLEELKKQQEQQQQEQERQDQQQQQQQQEQQQEQEQEQEQEQQQQRQQQEQEQQQQRQQQEQQQQQDQQQQQESQDRQGQDEPRRPQEGESEREGGRSESGQEETGSSGDGERSESGRPGEGERAESDEDGEGRDQPRPTPVPGQNEGDLEGDLEAKEPGAGETDGDPRGGMPTPDGLVDSRELSEAQARAILESLKDEDERVILFETPAQQPSGKDW